MINKRQAILLILICAISTKIQRLPSMISLGVGRDAWIIVLALGLIDTIFLAFALWFFNRHNSTHSTFDVVKNSMGNFMGRIVCFALFLYFGLKSILPSEAIHDLFANVLFDTLDFKLFGLILLGVVVFGCIKGLRTMGRQCEIYAALIGVGIAGVLFLGFTNCRLERVFPMLENSVLSLTVEAIKDNVWFGDFMILIYLTGKVSLNRDQKLGWNLVLPYFAVVCVIVPLSFVLFTSLYGNLAALQGNAISSLTQFSILALDIGRVGWFFVLFEQVSTVLAQSIFILMATDCFCKTFGIKSPVIPIWVLAAGLFMLDNFVFNNAEIESFRFRDTVYLTNLIIEAFLVVVLIISSLICKKKEKLAYICAKNTHKNAKSPQKTAISGQKMQKSGKIENAGAPKLNKMQNRNAESDVSNGGKNKLKNNKNAPKRKTALVAAEVQDG